jgi:hypothetical protein
MQWNYSILFSYLISLRYCDFDIYTKNAIKYLELFTNQKHHNFSYGFFI